MPLTIYKYEVSGKYSLPYLSKVVLAGKQNGKYFVWVEFDKEHLKGLKEFKIFPTGCKIDSTWNHEYSFQDGDMFTWHVYSRGEFWK